MGVQPETQRSLATSRPNSSKRHSTARSQSRASVASSRLSSRGEMRLGNGMKVPALNIINRPRTSASSVISGYTDDSARMDELSKVKAELEQALAQVKIEMKEGGASKSQFGASTTRSHSVMSDVSALTSSENWELDAEVVRANKTDRKLATHRGRAKMDLKKKGDKPLVKRPTRNKRGGYLPAPSPSAFRHPTHITTNQTEYPVLAPLVQAQNQGPTRATGPKRESARPFTKACESQVNSAAITGSKVFAPRVAAR